MNFAPLADSRQAWTRLMVALALMTIGSGAMYVVAVVLPSVQKEFGIARAEASLPYTLLMIGFGVGGIFMGRLADKRGVMLPILIGAAGLGVGFVAAGMSSSIVGFALVHGVLLGLIGSSATFAPLVADTSLWFVKRRGIAVAICASGNYVAGAIWPPIVQHFVETVGWRQTYIGMGVFCALTMPALALFMRARPPALVAVETHNAHPTLRPFGLSMNAAQTLLCIAGVSCCVAMSMPQVHIVAYCGDLGYGAARGAEMLSLMLACGVVSRLVSGAIWPPIVQHFVASVGWRQTYIGLGVFSALTMATLAIFMRGRPPALAASTGVAAAQGPASEARPFGLSTNAAQTLLCIAGVACCVAMSMPQVHIVAYCGDLGYGAARGAEMLSLMLASGVVSRLVSGAICDRIGGLRTLLLGSLLQGTALLLFLPFDSLASLYVVSALFGLFQGGIVPSYAIIVREHFPAAEAGARTGTILMFTLFGMALGGWMSGKVFDLTGSYHAAFLNGLAWNALNLSIAFFLLRGARGQRRLGPVNAMGGHA